MQHAPEGTVVRFTCATVWDDQSIRLAVDHPWLVPGTVGCVCGHPVMRWGINYLPVRYFIKPELDVETPYDCLFILKPLE